MVADGKNGNTNKIQKNTVISDKIRLEIGMYCSLMNRIVVNERKMNENDRSCNSEYTGNKTKQL